VQFIGYSRSTNSSLASGVTMMTGLMVFTPGTALAPADDPGHHAQRIPALGQLIGVEGIGDLARLEHWQCQQLIGWW
jgi:hypothetical protein